MNDQMEQVWRSKDGAVTGSKEEVEAYLKSKNPLGKMQFPYRRLAAGIVVSGPESESSTALYEELDAALAFANLAPLIQEARDAWASYWGPGWWHADPSFQLTKNLFLAYEEALKQVPQ